MSRFATMIAVVIVATGVFWMFPLFRVVRIDEAASAGKLAAFDAAQFAQQFWDDRLMPWLDEPGTIASSRFFAQFRDDPHAALEKFGRQVGVSRARLLVLGGTGTIASVDKKGVVVKFEGNDGSADVALHTGLVFGNAVRDATGLLDPGDFANSQHFNEVSTELNRLVESRVISALKEQAAPGRTIEFVGCAQVSGGDVPPVKIIPLRVKID